MSTTTTPPEIQTVDLVRRILEEITLHNEHLKVETSQLGRLHTVKIQVHAGDMSRVVGTGGSHSRALETIVGMIAARAGATIKTRILEPVAGEKDRFGKFEPRDQWNSEKAVGIARDIAEGVLEHPVKVENFDGEDYMSVVEVTCSDRENKELVRMLNGAMTPLFNAIGKANGRHLTVNIAPGDTF